MRTVRNRFIAPAAIVLALLAAPALAGCSQVESLIEGATGGNVELPGQSIPEGFPSEVPVVEGEIQLGAALSEGESTVYNVTVKVAGESPVESIKADLEGAGFTTQTEFSGDATEGGTLVYASDAWGVLVVVGKDPSGSGWIVNYTVTSTEAQ
jgi:hypothetical protein